MDFLAGQAWRARGEMPVALRDRPELPDHLVLYMDAFWSLCSDRGGDGSGQIQFTAIDAKARRLGFVDLDDFDCFESLMRVMDGVWLKHAAKERERARKAAEARAQQKG